MRVRLFTDAANTLWDTDAVYAAAQVRLGCWVSALSPRTPDFLNDAAYLAHVRHHDQQIALTHADGLRYHPMLLAVALHCANGGDGNPAVLMEVVEAYEDDLRAIPVLRPGVSETLPLLADVL